MKQNFALVQNLNFGLAMVGAEGPPLGGRLKPRTARPPRSGGRPQILSKKQFLANFMFISYDPFKQEVLGEYPLTEAVETEGLLSQSQWAFANWRKTSFEHRGLLLRKIAQLLRQNMEVLAALICREMGKPLMQARAEVEKSAWVCEHYAEMGASYLQTERIAGAEVWFQPLGLVLEVMPWNFPFWQVFRFTAPTLMAGNVVILKHAPNVPQCALAIRSLFEQAGFELGVFELAFWDNPTIAQVLGDVRVSGLALTGSVRAGSAVAERAGRHLKPCVLELGGSDAFIVLSDADLPKAIELGLQSRMHNSGQTCVAAKRFIVEEACAKAFIDGFLSGMKAYQPSSPWDKACRLSVLARPDLTEHLSNQVEAGLKAGARVLGGRGRLGQWFEPMLLTDIGRDNPLYEEELFGPVACLWVVKDEVEALRLANDSPFGLGASVWSQDLARAKALGLELEVGTVALNQMVKSEPSLPFGGIKRSGIGRELGREGIRSFVNVKTLNLGV